MKKIFITYGDNNFKESRERIGREARALNFFDEVIVYAPEDMPSQIRNSPLMKYARGGGYWCWKPYILWATLQENEDDTVVFFADAGCKLHESPDWERYLELIQRDGIESIVIQYHSKATVTWKGGRYPMTSRYWTKASVIEYFSSRIDDVNWVDEGQTQSALVIAKNRDNKLASDWYNVVLSHPEFFSDSRKKETNHPEFVEHRHDQSVLTAVALSHKDSTLFMPNRLRSKDGNVGVIADRVRDNRWIYILKREIKKLLGIYQTV